MVVVPIVIGFVQTPELHAASESIKHAPCFAAWSQSPLGDLCGFFPRIAVRITWHSRQHLEHECRTKSLQAPPRRPPAGLAPVELDTQSYTVGLAVRRAVLSAIIPGLGGCFLHRCSSHHEHESCIPHPGPYPPTLMSTHLQGAELEC